VLYLAGLALSVGANRQRTAMLIARGTNVDRYDASSVRSNEMSPFVTLGFNTGTNSGELTLATPVAINKHSRQSDTAQRQAGVNTGIVDLWDIVAYCAIRIAGWKYSDVTSVYVCECVSAFV